MTTAAPNPIPLVRCISGYLCPILQATGLMDFGLQMSCTEPHSASLWQKDTPYSQGGLTMTQDMISITQSLITTTYLDMSLSIKIAEANWKICLHVPELERHPPPHGRY